MIPTLRPYQLTTIDRIRALIRQGHKRILVQIPTGGGKTLTAVAMLIGALSKGTRSMFVAHRLELIDQTVTTFANMGVLSIGVIRAKDPRTDPKQPIQVASIQTLARRGKPEARIVFIDEAHRSCSPSYVKHLFDAYPDAIFIGLTATPCRADGKPLGAHWTAIVQETAYSKLIADGHLSAPVVYSTPILPDLTTVRTVAGDYNAEDLEAAVNRRALIGNLLAEWQKRSGGRRTVAFAVSVAHSRAIVEMFTEAGVKCEHLDGETPEDLRRAILARLASGETTLVSNVGVLCEGWDLPPCKCMLLARPTKSLALYMQMAGRILRPWEGEVPVILDHGGNVDRHGFPHEDREWSLTDKPKRVGTMPLKACKECFAMVPAAVAVCPHCGYEWPAPESPEPPKRDELSAVELAMRTLDGDDAKLSYFRKLAKEASERRWKAGAVLHKYREKFNEEPPRAWQRRLWKVVRDDPEWKETAFSHVPGAWGGIEDAFR